MYQLIQRATFQRHGQPEVQRRQQLPRHVDTAASPTAPRAITIRLSMLSDYTTSECTPACNTKCPKELSGTRGVQPTLPGPEPRVENQLASNWQRETRNSPVESWSCQQKAGGANGSATRVCLQADAKVSCTHGGNRAVCRRGLQGRRPGLCLLQNLSQKTWEGILVSGPFFFMI